MRINNFILLRSFIKQLRVREIKFIKQTCFFQEQ